MQHDEVGVCVHGKPVHYRYPCVDCESDDFAQKFTDELPAGWTSENGLIERTRRLHGAALAQMVARLTQGQ